MAKIYVAQKRSPSLSPLIDDLPVHERTWIEKFALRAFKGALICLIITMSFLVLTQQLLNRELAAENDRLRNLVNDKLDGSHPYFERYIAEFEDFKTRFNKVYESKAEEHQRRLIFFNKMQEIEKLNDESESTEFDVNEFADMTEEEFKQMLLPLNYFEKVRKESTFIKKMDVAPLETAVRIPPRLDWREKNVVTPVKSQHHCGSCWAFATVATVESNWAISHGELRNLSEQELLDCNLDNNACNGGDVDKAFRFVHESGLMTGEDYPYVAHRQNSCSLVKEAKIAKIDVAYWLNPTEDAILNWVVNYGPVNIGISVPPSMQAYKGGIYTPTPYECKFKVLGLHALLIVGYGTTDEGENYWIVKNSWGAKWGEAGYIRFARGINGCGIEDEPLGILA